MISEKILRQFIAVAESLNFGRAAERLHIAQPALSYAVGKLERHLGVRLLHRGRGGVSLTPAGHTFLAEGERLLQQIGHAVEQTRAAAHGKAGKLTIGFLGTCGYGLMPRLVEHFRGACPDVELQLFEMSTLEQLAAFADQRIDLGLLRTPFFGPQDDLETHLLTTDELVAALPAGHPLSGRKRITISDLRDARFVVFGRDHVPAAYASLMALCLGSGFHPTIIQECAQVSSMLSVVAAGTGVGIVPGDLLALRHQRVRFVPLSATHPAARVEVSLAWRKDSDHAGARNFVASARACLEANAG
ncbi:MAG: LysR family transcriptional regulator [Alcaligenaceae bacterium]|nr:LysR family transcriptional regulator [Alcaligenaceae bacterium SAGV5]MPS50760.1 LysR family transcriptional regulator [Alcaligenaceae bacterium SAGV3]MPT57098.1 LysR family transcriptional regulator [Alcaligenaceae bacterium]